MDMSWCDELNSVITKEAEKEERLLQFLKRKPRRIYRPKGYVREQYY